MISVVFQAPFSHLELAGFGCPREGIDWNRASDYGRGAKQRNGETKDMELENL